MSKIYIKFWKTAGFFFFFFCSYSENLVEAAARTTLYLGLPLECMNSSTFTAEEEVVVILED